MTIDICAENVKSQDYGRYVTILFAPRSLRKFLWVLYAINCELMHIRQVVAAEKMMGLIRLQWWRDSIAALYKGQHVNHHVLQGLSTVMQDKIVWQEHDFKALITAYENDFHHDEHMLSSQVTQNEILLRMALQVFDKQVEPVVINMIAKHYTQAKALLRHEMNHEMNSADKKTLITDSLRELDNIERKKIRGTAPLLWGDIARYDYTMLLKGKIPSPEVYRFLMAFYLWRRNLFF